MNRIVVTLIMGAWLALTAHGQIAVELRAAKDNFLLFESLPFQVGIRNLTGRTLDLPANSEPPWLEFIVLDEAGRMIEAVAPLHLNDGVLIPPGQMVSREVDLLPLFDLRKRGNYRVQARVTFNGVQTVSHQLRFTIMEGRELWKQTVGLAPDAAGRDRYRTYQLLARRNMSEEMLHVRVMDEPNQLVYGVLALGGFIPIQPPEARTDREGVLHVLFQSGPRTFAYYQIDPQAKVIYRAGYSDRLTKPRLVQADGVVRVIGGEQTYPRPERILTEEEIIPPPAPPPPKPEKKSWWPFGRKKTEDKKSTL